MNEVSLGNGGRVLGNGQRIACQECPLRIMPHFRPFELSELEFVSSFKTGELVAEAGTGVLSEGAHNAALYTVLSGWAFRYKTLEDGRRQVLNYLLPGDLVGLQGPVMGELSHSVEALSDLVLCVFQRNQRHNLFANHPGLGFDVTWLAATRGTNARCAPVKPWTSQRARAGRLSHCVPYQRSSAGVR